MIQINLPAFYALSFVIAALTVVAVTPVLGRLATRLSVLDHPRETKFHTQATPYLGGLAVAGGLILTGGVAAGASGQLLAVLVCGLALGILGLMDDQGAVGPRVKLLMETSAGIALWLAGIRAGLFDVAALDLLLTVLWVVAVTNAVNILDNMDGLAAGVVAIAASTFFAIAASRGIYLVGAMALAVAGASVGFLRYNFPPARIFLGDAGTLFLGFLLASLGLKLDLLGENGFIRSAVPILILGVPFFDLILVVTARVMGGRPIYSGGTDHSSHRLASLGFSNRAVAFFAYGMQVGFCLLGLSLLWMPLNSAISVVIGTSAVAGIGILLLLRVETLGEKRVTHPEAFHTAERPIGPYNVVATPTEGPE
jgi:UDP-GlcNAc:undecaprenyl-phosphate/decaprenyl-phosphate GlcNAc-1-phosphate transferase